MPDRVSCNACFPSYGENGHIGVRHRDVPLSHARGKGQSAPTPCTPPILAILAKKEDNAKGRTMLPKT